MPSKSYPAHRSLWIEEAGAMLSLAWPLILSQVAQIAFFTTDIIMMGWLGPDSLAGISLATALLNPFLIGGFGVVSATAPMVSQALGAREFKSVRRTVRQGLWVALLVAGLIIPIAVSAEWIFLLLGQPEKPSALAASYLDIASISAIPALSYMVLRLFISSKGKTGAILAITLISVALNVVFNYVLIFGKCGFPAMGIVGAALATMITNWLMLFMGMVYASKHPKFRRHHVFARFFKPDWPRFFEFLHIGWPIGLTSIAEAGFFGFAVILMGWIGTEAVAAHAIAAQYASISFMVPLGLSQATTIRVGHAKGARDPARVGRAGWSSLVIALLFMSCAFMLFVSMPRSLVGLFLDASRPENANIIVLAASYLVVAGLFQLFDGAQVSLTAALRGLSDTRVPMIVAMIGYWLVGVIVAYVCGFVIGWNGVGVWIGLAVGLAFNAVVLAIRWTRREQLGLVTN